MAGAVDAAKVSIKGNIPFKGTFFMPYAATHAVTVDIAVCEICNRVKVSLKIYLRIL